MVRAVGNGVKGEEGNISMSVSGQSLVLCELRLLY